MYIKKKEHLDDIEALVQHIENCINEIKALAPNDLTYKDLRFLATEIIQVAREMKKL